MFAGWLKAIKYELRQLNFMFTAKQHNTAQHADMMDNDAV